MCGVSGVGDDSGVEGELNWLLNRAIIINVKETWQSEIRFLGDEHDGERGCRSRVYGCSVLQEAVSCASICFRQETRGLMGGLRGGLKGGCDLQHVASRLFTAAKMQVVLKARGVSGEVLSMQASDGGKSSLCKCDNRLKHALHTKWSNY